MNEKETVKNDLPRRSFLKGLVLGVLGFTGLIFAAPAAKYLLPKGGKEGENFLLNAEGKPVLESEIKEGSSLIGLSKDGPTIAIRRGGKLSVLSAVCTHLGCLVKWLPNEEIFLCPCHAGRFDVNGVVISGPPSSPLPVYAARTDETGRIILEQS